MDLTKPLVLLHLLAFFEFLSFRYFDFSENHAIIFITHFLSREINCDLPKPAGFFCGLSISSVSFLSSPKPILVNFGPMIHEKMCESKTTNRMDPCYVCNKMEW